MATSLHDIVPESTPETKEFEDCAFIVGPHNGLIDSTDFLKLDLNRPTETVYLEELPSVVRYMAAAISRNSLYVVGLGIGADEIWKYDFNSGWHKCASLIQERELHSVAFVGEVLYVCGGYVNAKISALDSVEAYNVITDTCATVGKLKYPCKATGNCLPIKESLYIFGGLDESDVLTRTSVVQIYNTIQNNCEMLSNPMPCECYMMRAALWRDKVILLGNENCFIYDLEKETWQTREQFKTDAEYFGLAVLNNRIYVIGGGQRYIFGGRKLRWRCREDVRSVAIEDIIENKPAEWKVDARLPKPYLVKVLATNDGKNDDVNMRSDVPRSVPEGPVSLQDPADNSGSTKTANVDEGSPTMQGVCATST